MTNEEMQELESQLKSLDDHINETDKNMIAARYNLIAERQEIYNKIYEERISRTIERGMPEFKRLAIELVNTGMSTTRETKQLWMVKFGDRWFKSEKGKLTWTSEGRCLQAIANYIEYNGWRKSVLIPAINKKGDVKIIDIVKELYKEGYIKTVRIY